MTGHTEGCLCIRCLANAYEKGALTPQEVINDIYCRIEEKGLDGIWIRLRDKAQALEQARSLESRRGAPLYGIPFAIKDNIDVLGMPTTAGCPVYERTPEASATVVRLLEEAGAILVGKTNMDQFATGLVGIRSPYGVCRNAFSREHIPGGSSSGSAVAVAAGLVSFSLGTDTAGSGRVPAGFNNIVGLKPTRGTVSNAGVVPACLSLDCVSVFALTCADAAQILKSIQKHDPLDPYSLTESPRPSTPDMAGGAFRFGIPEPADLKACDDFTRQCWDEAVARMERLGGRLVRIDFSSFRETAELLYNGPWVAERYADLGDFLAAHPGETHPVVTGIINQGVDYSAPQAFQALHRLQELARHNKTIWNDIDVLLTPTTPTIYTIAEVEADPFALNANLGTFMNFVNLLDLAALSVPSGFRADGLPFGVTISAPASSDRQLARLGAAWQRDANLPLGATGVRHHQSPPPPADDGQVLVAVVGAHLTGLELNHQLTDRGAKLVEATRTAEKYRLYRLPAANPAKPGLVHVERGGVAVNVEVWRMPLGSFGNFVRDIPAPLCIGSIELANGSTVKGFLCESFIASTAADISAHGGWKEYLSSSRP